MRQLVSHDVMDVFAVHDQLVGVPPRKRLDPLRCFSRKPIAGVRPEVVDREDQWIAAQQRQRQIEPQVPALIVEEIWPEVCDGSTDPSHRPQLPYRLPQPGAVERRKAHGIIERRAVHAHHSIRKQQRYVGVLGQTICQADAVFPKVEGNQGDADATAGHCSPRRVMGAVRVFQ